MSSSPKHDPQLVIYSLGSQELTEPRAVLGIGGDLTESGGRHLGSRQVLEPVHVLDLVLTSPEADALVRFGLSDVDHPGWGDGQTGAGICRSPSGGVVWHQTAQPSGGLGEDLARIVEPPDAPDQLFTSATHLGWQGVGHASSVTDLGFL